MLRQAKPLVTAAFHNRLSMTAPAFYWWMPQLRDCNESHMVFRWRHCLGLRTMDCVSTVTSTAQESQHRWFSTAAGTARRVPLFIMDAAVHKTLKTWVVRGTGGLEQSDHRAPFVNEDAAVCVLRASWSAALIVLWHTRGPADSGIDRKCAGNKGSKP